MGRVLQGQHSMYYMLPKKIGSLFFSIPSRWLHIMFAWPHSPDDNLLLLHLILLLLLLFSTLVARAVQWVAGTTHCGV